MLLRHPLKESYRVNVHHARICETKGSKYRRTFHAASKGFVQLLMQGLSPLGSKPMPAPVHAAINDVMVYSKHAAMHATKNEKLTFAHRCPKQKNCFSITANFPSLASLSAMGLLCF